MSRADERPEVLRLLEQTPRTLDGWLRDLPDELLDATEGPGTFSARDVVAHLIQGEEEDWMPRLALVFEHGEARAFEPFDREGFRRRGRRDIGELLDELATLRRRNLDELDRIDLFAERLDLRGRHPDLGTVTVSELLHTWVAHDLAHLAQVTRVLTRGLEPRIGPWRAYFSALRDG